MNGNSFVGEVRLYAGDNAPNGWVICDGRGLDINDYMNLYSVILETFGGDGQRFNVPDLRGRVPVHVGNKTDTVKLNLGNRAGAENIELTPDHLPPHGHLVYVTGDSADSVSPEGAFISQTLDKNKSGLLTYAPYDETKKIKMSADSVVSTGSSTKAPTVQSFVAMNYIICYEGVMAMVENYIGEVKMFPCWNDRLAKDWIQCNGQVVQIDGNNRDLAGILKTQYGGDGQTNFGVPDLSGRTGVGGAIGDQVYGFGKKMGAMTTMLKLNNMPAHRHDIRVADGLGSSPTPADNLLALIDATKESGTHYLKGKPSGNLTTMDMHTLSSVGSATPISNVQPVLGLVFAIAIKGIYPQKS